MLVAIDDRSVSEVGNAHWNGSQLAGLVRRVDAAGARRIHIDAELGTGGPPEQAQELEGALAGARAPILLPARFSINPVSGARSDYRPPARFARHGRLVNTNLFVWWDDAVWLHPYSAEVGDRPLASLSSVLGGAGRASADLFPIDYGIDIRSIPVVSASDILNNRIRRQQLAGRDIVIARTDFATEHYRAPGAGQVPSILFHLVAAETLLAGQPVNLGWAVPLALALLLAAAILASGGARSRPESSASHWPARSAAWCCSRPIRSTPMSCRRSRSSSPPLLARAAASLRRSYQSRGTTNIVTGMPNLQALRQCELNGGIVVSARVKNYAQITTTLPPQDEKELVEQIVGRLEFGTGRAPIYQADEGVFVWIAGDGREEATIQQVEGLQALFRSPIVIASRLIDLAVTFGLDLDASRPLMQRVSSALVAADEAARDGKRWASFNPASMEDADWAMSLLGRLDHAIDNDELWVAYQPKLDCRTGQMVGAEALVRWTHPEKGQLAPDQFVGAAEQGGRIERLTYFVLDSALAAAVAVHRHDPHFTIAVNLSALLLSSDQLAPTVEALLRKHGVRPGTADPRGDGNLDPGQRRRPYRQPAAAERHGGAALDRRLRNRLLHARISAAHPRFGNQDRPQLHQHADQFAKRPHHGQLDDPARPLAGAKGGGRRRGEPGHTRRAEAHALRHRPGLPYRPAGAARRAAEAVQAATRPAGRLKASFTPARNGPASAGLFLSRPRSARAPLSLGLV